MDAGLVPSFLHVLWIWRAVGVGCQVAGEGWTPGLVFCSGCPWAGHRWHGSAGAPPVIPARDPDSHLLVCGMSPFLPFPVPTAPQSGNNFQRPPDLGFSQLLTGPSASLSLLSSALAWTLKHSCWAHSWRLDVGWSLLPQWPLCPCSLASGPDLAAGPAGFCPWEAAFERLPEAQLPPFGYCPLSGPAQCRDACFHVTSAP